jgi:Bifunctional DNA primase/polymerase, N-terminal/AAA domain/Primase C terminal 1 (PriCT-1)
MSNRKLRAALRAAKRGWLVFPVHGVCGGICSCSDPYCESPGKHPRTANGFKDATRDAAQIRDLWTRWPDSNVGLVTGAKSGFVVLDVDSRHGGDESLEELELEHGPLPNGPCVRTGGGQHRLFAHPGFAVKSKISLRRGLDFKGEGAYVVGVSSNHVSGNSYLWAHGRKPTDVPLPTMPAWLLELVSERRTKPNRSEERIPEGARNTTLTSFGGAMRGRGLSEQAIAAALLQENTLRCDPPLPDAEVESIARSIGRYPSGDSGIVSAALRDIEAKERKLNFRTAAEIADQTPAETPWVFEPLLAFGALTDMAGKVKQGGKTTFATHLIAKIVTGEPFMDQPTVQTPVVYLTEQPPVSFRATIEKAGLLGCRELFVLFWTDAIGLPWELVVRAAVAECKRRGARLLVVDTLPQFAGLVGDSENSAGDALKAIQPLQQAAAAGIAVLIVRHERKSGGALGDSGRGSSAFAGAVDILISIRRPDGNHPPNVRLLQSISRFDASDDLLIQLTDNGYVALGGLGEAAKQRASDAVLSAIPKSKKDAVTIEVLGEATGKKRAHLQRLLDALAENKQISKLGRGRKGSPFRYFRS